MVERQTENLKVESSILFIDNIISQFLVPYIANNSSITSQTKFSRQLPNKILHSIPKHLYMLHTTNKPQYQDYLSYQQFNLFYLRNIYEINLVEKNVNAIRLLPKKLIKRVLFKTRYKHYKNFSIKYFNEVAYMFLVSIWLKNPKYICKFIKTKLDTVHFKKHRRYFLFFFKILNRYIIPNFKLLQVKGITLKFKGKLGRGGNARKQTKFYHKGLYSLSSKSLCLNRNSWDVWTKTGTVGCTFQIFYNTYDLLFNSIYNILCFNFMQFAIFNKIYV